MKKIVAFVVLLILPFLFVLLLLNYKNSLGEYYLGRNCDPSYPYLTNSLNLSQMKGFGVGLIAHPGTPVQELGAIVILITHSLETGKSDIVREVLDNPEFYLNNIFLAFLFFYFVAIYTLGITVYAKMKSLKAAIFLQLTPCSFYSAESFFQLTNISVEPILVFCILILIAIIISFISKKVEERNSFVYVILFGVVCGMGLATKISFFPILIIPFILINGTKQRGLFLLTAIVAFFMFVYPAFSSENAVNFFVWVKSLAAYSGRYGTGSENIVETSEYIGNIKSILLSNLIFSTSYILLWIVFILQFFPKYKSQIRSNAFYYLAIGILIAMTAQILIVAKHFSLYYMIPAYMFSILGLYIVNSIVLSLFTAVLKNEFKNYTYQIVIGILIIIIAFIQIRKIRKEIALNSIVRNESRKIVENLEKNYNNSIVVSTYECSSKQFALYLGCFFGGTQYTPYINMLKYKYPNNFYYNRWSNKFYELWDTEYIKSQILSANKFIFQAASDEVLDKFMVEIKGLTNKPGAAYQKLSSNSTGEALYEITLEQR